MSDDPSYAWQFEEGDRIIEDKAFTPSFERAGTLASQREYEITHRLVDPDTGDRYYHTEYDDGDSRETQLKSAKMVHNLYREIEPGESAHAE